MNCCFKGLPAVISMSVSVTDYFATYFASKPCTKTWRKKNLCFGHSKDAIGATRQHEQQRIPNRPPSQWMIPQLFVSQRHPTTYGLLQSRPNTCATRLGNLLVARRDCNDKSGAITNLWDGGATENAFSKVGQNNPRFC